MRTLNEYNSFVPRVNARLQRILRANRKGKGPREMILGLLAVF